ncbi:MAG: undecaprenyl-diphosphate phosphatase, partial [Chitinophagales bacterium]
SIFQSVILAIVEGITEFLPISSTGHMIIASTIMGINNDDFVKMFEVVIQFGAILSVVVLYWRKFMPGNKTMREWFDFYLKLFVAFIPAAFFGLFFHDYIKQMIGSVTVVAVSMLAGGVVLIFIDKIFKDAEAGEEKPVTFPMAFKIGLFQVISMIPGVSRSAATIIGGMSQRLRRKQAAEFSFFLAVPTMAAASLLDLIEYYKFITPETLTPLLIGFVVAFLVAMVAIKAFVGFLTKHGFKVFGYYRIVVGAILLLLIAMGVNLQML